VAFTVMVFATMVLAVSGSVIEISTIGSSSLAILGTRSFTILTVTTGTIPMVIILTITDSVHTMNLFTKAVEYRDIASTRPEEDSATIRERIRHARDRQRTRFDFDKKINCNARMGPGRSRNTANSVLNHRN
jgi:hypothetical protein